MTNTTLQSFITTYGDRIFCINLDNTRYLYIGYKDGIALSDITLETVNDEDFIVVSKNVQTHDIPLKYKTYHATSDVQWIGVMDADYNDYRVDPFILR